MLSPRPEVTDILSLNGCGKSNIVKPIENDAKNMDIALQNLARQTNFILFLVNTDIKKENPDNIIKMVSVIGSVPQLIRDSVAKYQKEPLKISYNIASIATKWIIDCISKPKVFAQAITRYFTANSDDLGYFSSVIFPSLYRQFMFDEFQVQALKLIEELINLDAVFVYSRFINKFVFTDRSFSYTFWKTYDKMLLEEPLPVSLSDHFKLLLKSFSVAFNILSIHQQTAVRQIATSNRQFFAENFFGIVLYRNYKFAHRHIISKENADPVLQILMFMSENYASPQVAAFLAEIQSQNGYSVSIKQGDTFIGAHASIVLSFRDLLILQNVINSVPGLSVQLDKALMIPDRFSWVVDPVSIGLTFDFIESSNKSSSIFTINKDDVIPIEEDTEMKIKFKKLSILEKNYMMDYFDKSANSKHLTKLRKKIGSRNNKNFRNYVTMSIIDSTINEVSSFDKMLTLISNQKTIQYQRDIWKENLQFAMMNLSHRLISFNPTKLLVSSSLLIVTPEPMHSNAMRRYREVEQPRAKRRMTQMPKLDGSSEVFNFRKSPTNKPHRSKTKSKSYEILNVGPENQQFTPLDVAKILSSCQSRELDFWCYIGQINGWNKTSFSMHGMRLDFAILVNKIRVKEKYTRPFPAEITPYVQRLAKQFDQLEKMKSGMLLLYISKIIDDFRIIFYEFSPFYHLDSSILLAAISARCITDSVYTSFMISQKIMQDYKALNTLLCECEIENFEYHREIMWEFLEFLDKKFAEKSRQMLAGEETETNISLLSNGLY